MKFIKQAIHTGYICPHCGAEESGCQEGQPVVEYSKITLRMWCGECEQQWKEHYRMNKIEEIKGKVDGLSVHDQRTHGK